MIAGGSLELFVAKLSVASSGHRNKINLIAILFSTSHDSFVMIPLESISVYIYITYI